MLKYLTLVISLCLCVCVFMLVMEFSRQEYWGLFLFPSPKYLFNPGIKPWSPELQADSLPSELPGKPSGFIIFT